MLLRCDTRLAAGSGSRRSERAAIGRHIVTSDKVSASPQRIQTAKGRAIEVVL
jgi:hypothetical protein